MLLNKLIGCARIATAHSARYLVGGINGSNTPLAVVPRLSVTRLVSLNAPQPQKKEIEVTFIRSSGEKLVTKGKVGDSLLDVVVNNNIDLDGFGACEGTLTCSTCHLIFDDADFKKLPEKPSDEELDMLDLAFELQDTSRLGCQIILTDDMDKLVVRVPATINDARN